MSRPYFRRILMLVCVAVGCFLPACTTPPSGIPPGTRFIIATTRAPFYKYGPAQSFGADFVLLKNQRVAMLERAFGFSRVMTEDGVTGWVANEELAPAPATPPPSARALAAASIGKPRMYSGKRRTSNVPPIPTDPLFDLNDVPLPLPEEPAAAGSEKPSVKSGAEKKSKPAATKKKRSG